jgi:hypothetical protein
VLASGTNSAPAATLNETFTGKDGSYRIQLDVTGSDSRTDRDIRCVGLADANGFVLPPPQVSPKPLAGKPDEMNYAGQTKGWAGSDAWPYGVTHFLKFLRAAGGGGAGPSLSTAAFVDATTVVASGNDGSIGKPWATFTAAVAALPTAATDRSILIVDGDMSGETSPVTVPAGFTGVTCILGLGTLGAVITPFLVQSTSVILPNIVSAGALSLDGVTCSFISTDSFLSCRRCTVSTVLGHNIEVADCALGSLTCGGGTVIVRNSVFTGSGLGTAGPSVVIRGCIFTSEMTVTFSGSPGVLDIDNDSYQAAFDAGGLTIVNGTLQTTGPVRGEATIDFSGSPLDDGASITASVSVTGLSASMPMVVSPLGDLPAGLVIQCAYTGSDELFVQLCNASGLTLSPPSVTFEFMAGTLRTRSIT